MRAAAPLLMLLLAGGCDTAARQVATIRDPDIVALEDLKAQQAAGRLSEIADAPTPCTARSEACAQAQEIRGEACLTLARRQPAAPAAARWQDCAMDAFFAARAALPADADPARAHRLLANAASAAMDQRDSVGRGLDRQLEAATALLELDARDPAGCYHLASARLARSLLLPQGPGRCAELVLPASCAGVPPPPGTAAGQRLPLEEVAAQRRRLGCG